jgi:hypothetical protein
MFISNFFPTRHRTPANSGDYPLNIHHLRIQKPFTFRHGESTFERYTPVELMGFALIHDPNNLIGWENGADIQGMRYNNETSSALW